MIDIRPEELAIAREILRRRVPGVEAWAFGSRARGTAKPHSDLDLALIGEAPLDGLTLAELAEDFSASGLPFRVDVVDWAAAAPAFREIIRRDRQVIQPATRSANP
jgi:predicted nucleotidyltransferase